MSSIKAPISSNLTHTKPASLSKLFTDLPNELQCMVLNRLSLCNEDPNEQRSILNVRRASGHCRSIALISTRHMFENTYKRIKRVISSHFPRHPTHLLQQRFTRLIEAYATYQTTLPDITMLVKDSPLPSHQKHREKVLDELILSLASLPVAFEHFKEISTDEERQSLYPSPMFPNKEAYDNTIAVIECMSLLETISSTPDLTSDEQILKYNDWLTKVQINCSTNLNAPEQGTERAKLLNRVLIKKRSECLEIGNLGVPTMLAQYAFRSANMLTDLKSFTPTADEPSIIEMSLLTTLELFYVIFKDCSDYHTIIDKGLDLARAEGNYNQLESCRPFTMLHMGASEDGLSLTDFWISASIVINKADQLELGTFQEKYTQTLVAVYPFVFEIDQEEITDYAIRLLSCRGRLEDALTLVTQTTGCIEQISLVLSSKARCKQDLLSLFWHEDLVTDLNTSLVPESEQAILEIANKWISIQRNFLKMLYHYFNNAPSSGTLLDPESVESLINQQTFDLLNLFITSDLNLDQIKAVMNNPLLPELVQLFNTTTMLPVFELLVELDAVNHPQNASSSN